jgi:DNA-binding GntR family transcriptional regulator
MTKTVEIPPHKETGSARVYAVLRDEILRLQLAPGTPLDEVGLSERFQMSRSPIREALVRLGSEGLVVILPNRSTIVTPMDFQRMPEFLDALDLLQRAVTRLAAMHRTSADLTRIRKAQKAYESALRVSLKSGDSLIMIEKNYEFHMAIAQAGRNAYFVDLYRRLLEEGRRMLHLHFEYEALDPNISVEKMASHHSAMVTAIETHDADSAEEWAHLHAKQFTGRFMQFLDRNLTANMPLHYSSATLENASQIEDEPPQYGIPERVTTSGSRAGTGSRRQRRS